jgi:hypothetical protein
MSKLAMSRIRRVFEGCEFKLLSDLNADRVEVFLTELREKEDLGHKTLNHLPASLRLVLQLACGPSTPGQKLSGRNPPAQR